MVKKKITGWSYDFGIRIDGKLKHYQKTGFRTKSEAIQAEAEARKNADQIDKTFENIFNEYLQTLQCNEESKRGYILRLKDFPYKNIPISKITKIDLNNYQISLKENETPNKINRTLSYIKAVFRYANKIYDVPDVSSVLSYVKVDRTRKDYQVWSPEEFNQFLSCVTNPIYVSFFSVLYWCGLRRGEAMALHKDDLVGNKLIINKSLRRGKETKTKTSSSVREVDLDEKLMKSLQNLCNRKGIYLFGDDDCLKETNIQRVFDKAIEESSVTPIRIHDLRHSHISLLVASGIDIPTISERVGHSSVSMTLDVYTHALDDNKKALISKINDLKK